MYEAMGNMESQAEEAAAQKNFQIPATAAATAAAGEGGGAGAANGTSVAAAAAGSSMSFSLEPPSAIIAPSSVTHKSSPLSQVRHKELSPSGVDTGKDTQCLVEEEEEDESQC